MRRDATREFFSSSLFAALGRVSSPGAAGAANLGYSTSVSGTQKSSKRQNEIIEMDSFSRRKIKAHAFSFFIPFPISFQHHGEPSSISSRALPCCPCTRRFIY
jgi:hypothetical protein